MLENRLEVDDIIVEGGLVTLFGAIINTGGGVVKALSGYGNVSITNTTGYAIQINTIDTGRGVNGEIYIYDSNYNVTSGGKTRVKPTKYVCDGSNIAVYTNTGTNFAFVFSSSVTARTTQYTPKANQYYTWMTGQRISTETVETYGSKSFWGMDWIAPDPDDLISRETTFLGKIPLLQTGSDYIYVGDQGIHLPTRILRKDTGI